MVNQFSLKTELKKWKKEKIGTLEGTKGNWFTNKMEVNSLTEPKDKSGIDNKIFNE